MAIPDGVYRVVLSYQDALGHPAASATSTNVTIDTMTQAAALALPMASSTTGSPVSVDFKLPEQALPGSVKLTFIGAGSLVLSESEESAGAHTFIFDPANPAASAGVAGGSGIPDGTYSVELSYRDAVGNTPATATSTNVTITRALPGTAQLARKGSVVPGAGVDPRIPAGSTWGTFGVPSITMNGTRAGLAGDDPAARTGAGFHRHLLRTAGGAGVAGQNWRISDRCRGSGGDDRGDVLEFPNTGLCG